MDVSQRKGLYPIPQDASEILGVEFAGHVTALGPDTSASWAIGDQVLGLASGVSQHRGRSYGTVTYWLGKPSFFLV
jgi:NADPH:quinone reductase-like Zn-dependent oxidoreductase